MDLIGGPRNDRLVGGPGNDRLAGQGGNDTIVGNGGNDLLLGGAGNDNLRGGSGRDSFGFDSGRPFKSKDLGRDTIKDFRRWQDKILLDRDTFTALRAMGGTLKASDFDVVNNDRRVAGSSSPIVFSRASRSLFYNPNGIRPGLGSGARFATLQGVSNLSESNFRVV